MLLLSVVLADGCFLVCICMYMYVCVMRMCMYMYVSVCDAYVYAARWSVEFADWCIVVCICTCVSCTRTRTHAHTHTHTHRRRWSLVAEYLSAISDSFTAAKAHILKYTLSFSAFM